MRVSVIIPAWNEERALPDTLEALAGLPVEEIIVVDGGSTDATREIAQARGAKVIVAPRGRGRQLHAGAEAACGEVLWFLHADTLVSREALEEMRRVLRHQPEAAGGNFALRFAGESAGARFLEWLYPRLRWLGLCYGDSGFFVPCEAYRACGGFAPYPLFEDLDLLRRLKLVGRFVHLRTEIESSSRRWERAGFVRVFARWVLLQTFYWLGAPPNRLANWY